MDVICCTWKNVAIPSILFGCESIPFCDTNIEEIERVQSQVAKFALGVKVTTPNICAQTELGFKPFRQLLYENQLKFYLEWNGKKVTGSLEVSKKYGIYLFSRVETFLSKRHQVNMFLSTFQVHDLYF